MVPNRVTCTYKFVQELRAKSECRPTLKFERYFSVFDFTIKLQMVANCEHIVERIIVANCTLLNVDMEKKLFLRFEGSMRLGTCAWWLSLTYCRPYTVYTLCLFQIYWIPGIFLIARKLSLRLLFILYILMMYTFCR